VICGSGSGEIAGERPAGLFPPRPGPRGPVVRDQAGHGHPVCHGQIGGTFGMMFDQYIAAGVHLDAV
jgi:hypothetical protein